ncbi:WD repeat-containing protein 70 isoform X3 [Electrophorus electricus]|uniref:WD repeat-containing protein 70 isoform X3 n=1 Tax=Electrophorus electricus TaxID=8005 RepID=UPI0015CFD79E|nr:WD repeat-containing protein 70 isoform X3 [Electrophorus electricus]
MAAHGNNEKTGEGDLSSVMGFSGFGKKARTFDLEAIFEQTRRTAIERSQRVLEDRQQQQVQREPVPDAGPRTSGSSQREKPSASTSSRQQESSDSEPIGPPVPPAFTAQPDEDDEAIGPPPPPGYSGSTADDDDDDDDDSRNVEEEDDDDDDPVRKIPDTHEITLQHGAKTVSALGLDPSGARLVTGGYDYDVKFWDFAGMDAALQAFRSLQPCECHQIRSLQYSITGDVILVVAGNAQAKVLDRDGFQVLECIKGDQYIVDMANTKGHTAMLNSGCWHPKIKEEFLTCSNDGTVRTWDLNNEKKHKSVFKPRSLQGKKVTPTCCTYSRDGKLIAAGCQDGTIQIWDRNLSSVVRCLWHPKLNQIMVGTANGLAKVYYDPVRSQRGAKLCVVKSQRKQKQAETLTQDYIITPHALPMFREARQRSTRKQLEKDRLDPTKSHKPEPPVSGPGRGGRVAAHGGTLSSYIVKNIALDKTDDSNPREAILRHAKDAAENPFWVAPAYKRTQPNPVFADEESEDEEADKEPQWKKRKI